MDLYPGSGRVAKLGERIVRNDEAVGSIPISSTKPTFFQRINILKTAALLANSQVSFNFEAQKRRGLLLE